MSKFKKGDRVRVISITDIDADLNDPDRVITDNDRLAEVFGTMPDGLVVGATGTIVDFYNDYYDVSIKLDGQEGTNEYWSMIDADLELI